MNFLLKKLLSLGTCCILLQACQSESRFDAQSFFKEKCSICHENSEMQRGPNLFGLNSDYLYKQLMNFKSGKRGGNFENKSEALMGSAKSLIPDELDSKELVNWISRQKKPAFIYNLKGDFKGVELKAQLCLNCHLQNEALMSPNLLDLEPWYLLDQTRKFKRKLRGADESDVGAQVMMQSVQHLSDKELKKIILYLQDLMKKEAEN